jgi:hypothetical protein
MLGAGFDHRPTPIVRHSRTRPHPLRKATGFTVVCLDARESHRLVTKYQGGRRGRAGPIWQPFRDWLKAGPYPVAGKPLVGSRRAHRARASPVGRAEVPLPQRSGSGPLALAKSNGGRPCRRRTWHLRSRDQSCSKPRSPSGMMFLQRKRGAPNGRPVSWTDGVTGTASPSAQRCLLRSRPRTTGHCP